jgi:hypothetical protein
MSDSNNYSKRNHTLNIILLIMAIPVTINALIQIAKTIGVL